MSTKSHSLGGGYPYKMDAKGRVSIPSDWRAELSNSVLRLLVSHNEKIPTLKVLTDSKFEKMQQDINDSESMTPAQKQIMIGTLFEKCVNTHINDQGKLSVPKAQLDHPGLVPGEGLVLCGRGDYFEIFNEENHQRLEAARKATLERLDVEFQFF